MSVEHLNSIEADHVSMRFGGQTALDTVSFAIPEGAYVGIVGPNGGGKTTMLRIILGLQKPSAGTVFLFGQDPVLARRGGKVGYVPQRVTQTDFVFPATVEEIVRSGRATSIGIGQRFSKTDIAMVEEAMERVGINKLRHRIIGTLSGGERQKAFIARSLASEPRILILDEPTTGVDSASQTQFYALLKQLNKELGITILFVSHDVQVIAEKASFILALNQKLLCHCSSHEFLSDKTLRRLYSGESEILHHHHH
jgi:zinc transport system ATP-binding protein